ncbi:NIF3-like protein 1 [Acanthosepion pharaonis]|uniref:NIF3-like protein 1 n=1 Tax=Acanthosepion pharaonis TaxID=158019 RepID=A0A812DQR1_ACAPH|nr:NIF3-like protein 1 [Sepia pharaonis]
MPIAFAEDWDNVGLLVEPSAPHNVSKMLLTNDLTPEVLDEALTIKANLILSYHPPVFSPLKRLCQSDWKQKIVVKAIENRIAIYSPHTSCDSLKEGVNDWLLSAFDNACVMPLATKEDPAFCYSHSVTLLIAIEERSKLIQNLKSFQNVTNIESFNVSTFEQEKVHVAFVCTKSALPKIGKLFLEYNVENPVFTEIKKPPLPDVGLGRISKLKSKISLNKAIEIVKEHLKLPHVRVATSHGPGFNNDDEIIKSIAVCAGSGSSVLRGVKADLYITGEMSHHEVLSAIHNGSSTAGSLSLRPRAVVDCKTLTTATRANSSSGSTIVSLSEVEIQTLGVSKPVSAAALCRHCAWSRFAVVETYLKHTAALGSDETTR